MACKEKKTVLKKKSRKKPDEFLTTPFQIIILICDLQSFMPFNQMKGLDMEWEIKV